MLTPLDTGIKSEETCQAVDALFQHLAAGHRVMPKIGCKDDLKAGYIRFIAMLEMKKRGVRFLPSQVIKRALRKHQSAQPKKSTYFSDKPIVDMGEFPKMTLEE